MVSLSLDPPPMSARARSGGAARVLAIAIALLAAFGGGFWTGRVTARKGAGQNGPAGGVATAMPATGGSTATATPTPTPTATPTSTPTAIPTSTSIQAPIAAIPSAPDGRRRLVATLSGPLEDTIAAALGAGDRRLAAELTAVVNRLLVWDLHVARDSRKGDRLEVLWTPPRPAAPGMPESGDPVVDAVRYASAKLGKVVSAYRFQEEGARFARYYRPDGTEVEPRLVDAPVSDYEQITSLLRDGRRHKGVDFKTPVGSPVHAPFDGVIERRNWHFAANGNCLDIRDPASGRHAIFLHLDVIPKEMGIGRKVRKGEVIASSGNSGHSFAPHLHYQLEDASGKVLDPFDVQKTEKRSLGTAHRPAFESARAKLDAALGATL